VKTRGRGGTDFNDEFIGKLSTRIMHGSSGSSAHQFAWGGQKQHGRGWKMESGGGNWASCSVADDEVEGKLEFRRRSASEFSKHN
jgi:hypothetical protein